MKSPDEGATGRRAIQMEGDAPPYGRGGGHYTLSDIKRSINAYVARRNLRPRRGRSFCHDVLPREASPPADPLCD